MEEKSKKRKSPKPSSNQPPPPVTARKTTSSSRSFGVGGTVTHSSQRTKYRRWAASIIIILNLCKLLKWQFHISIFIFWFIYSFCFWVLGEYETNRGLRVSRVRVTRLPTTSTRFSQTCLMFRRWRRGCLAFLMTSTLENYKPLVSSYSTVTLH